MANIKAQASGNWSATGTWSGGVLPGSGDTAYSNGFTVTIDQDITVVGISKAANGGIGASAGGQFTITSAPRTLTISGGINAATQNETNSSNILSFTHTSGTVTINGNITGGAGSTRQAIAPVGGGSPVLVINGNVTGGTAGGSYGIGSASVSLNCTINGNVTAGTNVGAVNPTSWTLLTINGTVTGSATAAAVISGGSVNMLINGDVDPTNYFFSGNGNVKIDTPAPATPTGYPAEADVRDGEVYGNASEFTGTLEVPDPSDVAAGVPVDGTVGTGASISPTLLADIAAVTGAQIAAATTA